METNNKYDFFENVKVDADGNLMVFLVSESGNTPTDINSEYEFFKSIELTPEGYIKITID